MNYKIITRVCDRVFSTRNANRPYTKDKNEIVKKTLISLIRSVENINHEFIVIADNSSDELIKFINNNVTNNIHVTNGGASTSLQKQLSLALEQPDESWVYFCEDDYLHSPNCFRFIDDLLNNRNEYLQVQSPSLIRKNIQERPLIIHPPDYPDRYKPSQIKPAWLFRSKHCHWRMIDKTTHSFLTQASTVKRYEKQIHKSTIGPSDAQLSKRLYGGLYSLRPLCLSPIPGLSTHLTNGVMTPFVDWKKVWDDTV